MSSRFNSSFFHYPLQQEVIDPKVNEQSTSQKKALVGLSSEGLNQLSRGEECGLNA